MVNYKKRLEKLEGRIRAGEGVILLDEINGVLYRDGKKTTIAKERENNSQAIFLIDNIQ